MATVGSTGSVSAVGDISGLGGPAPGVTAVGSTARTATS